MSKLLLFDLDGTMVSTQGAGMRAMHRAGVMVFGEAFSFEGVATAGGLDPLLFAAAAEHSGIEPADHHHQTFRETYYRVLPEELIASRAKVRVLPGVVELLESLRTDPRITLGLLTGNYGVSAEQKLRAVGIDPGCFVIQVFGDEAPDRPSLVPVGMARYEAAFGRPIAHRDVIIIGDTPKDVHAAKTHGCRCIAVATGPYSVEQLQKAGADVALPDLSDATAVWEMITN